MWKDFKNLFGKSRKDTNKPITKIINNQLDIKLGQLTQEKLDEVQRKTSELLVLMKYQQKYERQGNSTTFYSDTATPYIIRTQ